MPGGDLTMWDATRGRDPLTALAVLGLFRRKSPTTTRVHVDLPQREAAPPPPPPPPPQPPIKQDLRFQDLHDDVDPARNVRTAEMACGDCNRTFRYFRNADGKPTTARCPGCGRRHSVS